MTGYVVGDQIFLRLHHIPLPQILSKYFKVFENFILSQIFFL